MNCISCGSEWLYMSKRHHLWCSECYGKARHIVNSYHEIQDEAKEHITNGRIEEGIKYLYIVIELRNKLSNSFSNGLNSSHHYFANLFLPKLINKLKKAKRNHIMIWEKEFSDLTDFNWNEH